MLGVGKTADPRFLEWVVAPVRIECHDVHLLEKTVELVKLLAIGVSSSRVVSSYLDCMAHVVVFAEFMVTVLRNGQ